MNNTRFHQSSYLHKVCRLMYAILLDFILWAQKYISLIIEEKFLVPCSQFFLNFFGIENVPTYTEKTLVWLEKISKAPVVN